MKVKIQTLQGVIGNLVGDKLFNPLFTASLQVSNIWGREFFESNACELSVIKTLGALLLRTCTLANDLDV